MKHALRAAAVAAVMKLIRGVPGIALASVLAGALWGANAAQAATLTFDSWTDTEGPSTSPLLSITQAAGHDHAFVVSLEFAPGSFFGSVIALHFDVGTGYGAMALRASDFAPVAAASTSGVIAYGAAPPQTNMNGTGYSGFDFSLLFDKKDAVGGAKALSFRLEDANALLTLGAFAAIGVRVQEVGLTMASDKLVGHGTFSDDNPPLPVVPLPATGLLLLGALGVAGALGLRHRAG